MPLSPWVAAAAALPVFVAPAVLAHRHESVPRLELPAIPVPVLRPQLSGLGWTWPLTPPATVLAGFAPPAHDWLPGRRGVQLAARAGQPVFAAGPGVVRFAGRIGSVGVVAIRHPDGLETTYEPVAPLVHAGAGVLAGARIGTVAGRLPQCRQTCLAWGLRRGQAYLDPLILVGGVRVRLLPMLDGVRRD